MDRRSFEASPWSHDTLGPYRLRGRLGRGGQGVVVEAEDTRLGRIVALKIFPAVQAGSVEASRRMLREAHLISRLEHPGLCKIYEAGCLDDVPFLAMQRLHGESMADRIAAERQSGRAPGRSEILAKCRVVEQVARAVQVAHQAGVVHRDLKPSNVLLTANDQPVVLDFGLARDMEEPDGTLTRAGSQPGTPAYLAPEQLRDHGTPAGPAADQYALGVLLYEYLTSEKPHRGPNRDALYHAILEDPVPRLRSKVPAAPRDLDVVLATALSKEPRHRYASAAAFADDLAAVVASRPVSVSPPGRTTQLLRWTRRHPTRALLIGGVLGALLFAAALAGYLLAQRDVLDAGQRAVETRRLSEQLQLALDNEQTGTSDESEILRALEQDPALRLPRAVLCLARLDGNQIQAAADLLAARPASQLEDPAFVRLEAEVQRLRAGTPEAPSPPLLDGETDAVTDFVIGSLLMQYRRRHPGTDAGAQAIPFLRRAVHKAARAELVFHFALTRMLYLDDQFELHREAARAMASLWPDSVAAWSERGLACTTQEDHEGARAAFLRAVDLFDGNPQTLAMLSTAEIALGLLDESEQHFRRAIGLLRESPDTVFRMLTIRGQTMLLCQQFAAAVPVLEDVLRRDPTHSASRLRLAQCLDQLGQTDAAHAALWELLELDPEHTEASRTLCHFYQEVGDELLLEEELRRRVDVVPADGGAWFLLATLLDEIGDDPDQARIAADRARPFAAAIEVEFPGASTWLRERE